MSMDRCAGSGLESVRADVGQVAREREAARRLLRSGVSERDGVLDTVSARLLRALAGGGANVAAGVRRAARARPGA